MKRYAIVRKINYLIFSYTELGSVLLYDYVIKFI